MEKRGQGISIMSGHSGSKIPQRASLIMQMSAFLAFCWEVCLAREDSKLIASVAAGATYGL
jgi:hypothetical protein